jgi:hypothetical protein
MLLNGLFKCTISISTESNHVKLVRYNLKMLCQKLQTSFEGVRELMAQKLLLPQKYGRLPCCYYREQECKQY